MSEAKPLTEEELEQLSLWADTAVAPPFLHFWPQDVGKLGLGADISTENAYADCRPVPAKFSLLGLLRTIDALRAEVGVERESANRALRVRDQWIARAEAAESALEKARGLLREACGPVEAATAEEGVTPHRLAYRCGLKIRIDAFLSGESHG